MSHETARQAFVREATHALLASGFTSCGPDETNVLLFDSTPWRHRRADAYALLSVRERERALRFVQPHDRDTYVLAHAFWRLALGHVLDTDAASVAFTITEAGKPLLPGNAHATSLSHTGSHVAVAIGMTATLGIDIEQSAPRTPLRDVARIVCSAAEMLALDALPAHSREFALLELWTRKEALLKAFGTGLREPPSSVQADIGVDIAPPASAGDVPPCRVHPIDLPTGLVGAIAAPASMTRVSLHLLASPHAGNDSDRITA